jgi:acetyltransferase-like isoleucine patch superfamily enzyme
MANYLKKYITGLYFLSVLICGKIPSHTLRKQLYKLLGLRIGKHSTIYGGAEIRHVHRIKIGNNSIIGHNAILDGRGGLEIGNNVSLGTGVWIWTAQHDINDPYFNIITGKVIIEDYAWIAVRAIILPNVTVGKGAVVGAGAVVTKNVEPYSVVAGVPAKKIGERNSNLLYNLGDFGYMPFY